eukprot:2055761-Rhodomonas_salina.1
MDEAVGWRREGARPRRWWPRCGAPSSPAPAPRPARPTLHSTHSPQATTPTATRPAISTSASGGTFNAVSLASAMNLRRVSRRVWSLASARFSLTGASGPSPAFSAPSNSCSP